MITVMVDANSTAVSNIAALITEGSQLHVLAF